MRIQKVFICLYVISSLAACSSTKEDSAEPPHKYDAKVAYKKAGEDARCSCDRSQMAFLTNTDPKNDVFVKYEIKTKLGGNPSVTHLDNAVIAKEGIHELGCTKVTNGALVCSQENSWAVTQTSALVYTASKSGVKGLSSPFFTYDNQSCVALCNSKTECYSFGPKAAHLAAPLIALVEAGQSPTDKTITAEEILKEYNLKPEDNLCHRGEVSIKSGTIRNDSVAGCVVESKKDEANGIYVPLSLNLPPKIEAQNTPSNLGEVFPLSNAQEVFFSDGRLSPTFGFAGANAADMNELYGGAIKSITKINDTVYIANTNGCVSIRMK
jgi:hypothetical protein